MSDLFGNNMCVRKDNTLHFGVNILTHVTFLFTVLTCLFVFFTRKIVEDPVNDQVIDLINDNVEEKKNKFSNILRKMNLSELSNFDMTKLKNIFAKENSERNNNNNLITKILFLIITAFIIMLILVVATNKLMCGHLSMKEILIENVIIFIFIGIVEMTFFLKIALKYIPAYPSTFSKIVLKTLKEI